MEKRFARLFEVLEIVCRFVHAPEDKMHAKVRQALKRVPEPLQVGILCTMQLCNSLERLQQAILPSLESEVATPGYSGSSKEALHRSIGYFRKNWQNFAATRAKPNVDTAEALLLFCITLRNCRFHACPSTSGDVVGYQNLLGPLCDGFERILLEVAASIFDKQRSELEAHLTNADTLAVPRGEIFVYDPSNGGFRLTLGEQSEQLVHAYERPMHANQLAILMNYRQVKGLESSWGTGGIPIVGLTRGDEPTDCPSASVNLKDRETEVAGVTVYRNPRCLSLWFAAEVSPDSARAVRDPKTQVTIWLAPKKMTGGSPLPSLQGKVPHSNRVLVEPLAGLEIPSGRIDGYDALSTFAIRPEEIRR